MKCSVKECRLDRRCRGFCLNHYGRWYRHGDPLAGGPSRDGTAKPWYRENRIIRFSPERWSPWWQYRFAPHPHRDRLAAGIDEMRRRLESSKAT